MERQAVTPLCSLACSVLNGHDDIWVAGGMEMGCIIWQGEFQSLYFFPSHLAWVNNKIGTKEWRAGLAKETFGQPNPSFS